MKIVQETKWLAVIDASACLSGGLHLNLLSNVGRAIIAESIS